jgi:predicted metal-binding transcription factor (methanogenesis marker protein 9)
MSDLENIYEAKARELVALFQSGDISHEEFMELKEDLLDLEKIEKKISQESLKITAAQIINAVSAILSVIK